MQENLPRLRMGRQKIAIKFIEKRSIRMQTFRKRAEGLYKKAIELHVLCNAVVELKVFFNDSNKEFFYSSHPDSPISLPTGVTINDVINSAKRPPTHKRKAPKSSSRAATGCTSLVQSDVTGSTASTTALVQYVPAEKNVKEEKAFFGCQGLQGVEEYTGEMEEEGMLAYKVETDDDEQGEDDLELMMNQDVSVLGVHHQAGFGYNDNSSHILYNFQHHVTGGGGGNPEALYDLEGGGKIEDGFIVHNEPPDHPMLLHKFDEGDFPSFLNDKPSL